MEQKVELLLVQVKDILSSRGIDSYLVGGYIRDTLLERATGDIDIAVAANAPQVAQTLARYMGGKYVLLDAKNQVARVVLLETDDITSTRLYLDLSTIEDDIESNLAKRDFTIDAIAVNLMEWQDGFPLPGLIDPFSGRHDLEKQLIRAVSDHVFQDDPVRLLRAVRLAAEYNFSIEEKTEALIQNQSHFIKDAAGERVREEFCRLLALPDAAEHLRHLDGLNILTAMIPELDNMKGIEQPYEHYWDVFEHSIETVASVERLLKKEELPGNIPLLFKFENSFKEEISGNVNRSVLLKLACLLHDVAKPQTKTLEQNGRARFIGHTKEGARIAGSILQRLRFSTREVKMVQKMIENHLRLWQMSSEGMLPTRRAIYRYFRDTDNVSFDIPFLTMADFLATYGPSVDIEDWKQCVELMSYIVAEREKEESIVASPKLIDGHDLINSFKLEPGPRIGELLEMVREAQAAGEIVSKDEALDLVQSQLEAANNFKEKSS
jgi:poly(A) polymerase